VRRPGRVLSLQPVAYIRAWPPTMSYRRHVDVFGLIPGLHFLRFLIGHAYLWHDAGGLTLIDTSGPRLRTADRHGDPRNRA
jgi:hypothetical protein